jgi:MFS family permease
MCSVNIISSGTALPMLENVITSTCKRVRGVFYGWWIVGSVFAIQMLAAGLLFQGFTVYFLPLQAEFGWSRTLISTPVSLTRLLPAVVSPFQGWIIDRVGPRPVVLVGVVILGAGFIVFSFVNSIPLFFLAFLLLSLGSGLAGFLSMTVSVANWFIRKRAFSLGISLTGMAAGGLLVAGLGWGVGEYGWRPMALSSGLLVLLVGIPASLVLRHRPEQYGLLPDGDDPTGSPPHLSSSQSEVRERGTILEHSLSTREALRTSAFWFIAGGHSLAVLAVTAISVHQVPHMVERVGISLGAASGIVAFLLAMMMIGQIGGGYLADKFDKRIILATTMLCHTAGLLVLANATLISHLFIFSILHGVAWGARGPTQHALRADYFGRASFGTIIGFSSSLVMFGAVCGPILTGWLADVLDSYTIPFIILAAITATGSLLFFFARRPEIPSSPTGTAT